MFYQALEALWDSEEGKAGNLGYILVTLNIMVYDI
jgi:hypothetical protein